MAWVKLDDQARHHRKVLAAGPVGAWLWVCGLMYCNSQKACDGFIPEVAVAVLYPVASWRKEAARLVSVGLWERTTDGYVVHDYHDYQPTAEELERQRQQKAAAGRAGGKARRSRREAPPRASPEPAAKHAASENEADAKQAAKHAASEAPKPVPIPIPSRTEDPPKAPRGATDRPKVQAKLVDVGTAGIEEVVHAYESAVAEATGKPFAVRNDRSTRSDLALAVNTHLRGDETILGAIAEVRDAVAEWVEAYRDKSQLTAGWLPRKFFDWLNGAERDPDEPGPPPRAPRRDEPGGHGTPMTPEQRAKNLTVIAELEANGFGGKFK